MIDTKENRAVRDATSDGVTLTQNGATLTHCRSCGACGLTTILSLGETPLANALPTHEQLNAPRKVLPNVIIRSTWRCARSAPWCSLQLMCRRKRCSVSICTSRRFPTPC